MCYISFWNFADKKSLIVGGQYGIVFAKAGEAHESSQRENYEKKSRGNSGKECRKVFGQSPGRVASYNGLSKEDRVELSFDGEKITVRPLASTDSELFRRNAEQKGHRLKEYRYYDGDVLCTVILADFTAQQVCVENKIDDVLDTAFGVNETPSWEDFLAFLADRCIPKTRKGLDYYLDAVGVPEYDPVQLVEKTQGRMAEDHKWLEII